MNAHGINVLYAADDDRVVMAVAHHLVLKLLPPEHRLFDEHLVNGAVFEPPVYRFYKVLLTQGNAATLAAKCE